MKLEDLLLYIDTGHISLSSYLPFITACGFFFLTLMLQD